MLFELPFTRPILKVLVFLSVLALSLFVPFFWVRIDPEQSYSFLSALVHGLFWWQNAFLAMFDGRLAWAATNTGWPYVFGFVVSLLAGTALWHLVNGVMQGTFMVIDEI